LVLADDEEAVVAGLIPRLRRSGFYVDWAQDGVEALRLIREDHFDLLVLDIQMPRIDGRQVLRTLREAHDPILVIMLTVVDDTGEVVEALTQGADDYISKPFEPAVLVARIQAVLRRADRGEAALHQAHRLWSLDLCVDTRTHDVWLGGTKVSLGPRALQLLIFLMRSHQQWFTRSQLLDSVWNNTEDEDDPDSSVNDRAVDMRVFELRRALGDAAASPTYIESKKDFGYRFKQRVEGYK
jgi:DNA-binding response OmpR family regulator